MVPPQRRLWMRDITFFSFCTESYFCHCFESQFQIWQISSCLNWAWFWKDLDSAVVIIYSFVMCVPVAAQQLSVFSAERCLSKTAGLLRLYAVLPHCDSVLADNVQRGPLLCQPCPLPHQAHLRFLLHTSSKAQILLRLDTRWLCVYVCVCLSCRVIVSW